MAPATRGGHSWGRDKVHSYLKLRPARRLWHMGSYGHAELCFVFGSLHGTPPTPGRSLARICATMTPSCWKLAAWPAKNSKNFTMGPKLVLIDGVGVGVVRPPRILWRDYPLARGHCNCQRNPRLFAVAEASEARPKTGPGAPACSRRGAPQMLDCTHWCPERGIGRFRMPTRTGLRWARLRSRRAARVSAAARARSRAKPWGSNDISSESRRRRERYQSGRSGPL